MAVKLAEFEIHAISSAIVRARAFAILKANDLEQPSPIFPTHQQMSLSKTKRFRVLERHHFKCVYCGRSPPEVKLEVDHKTPKARGGLDNDKNLVAACRDCNIGKGRYPVVDYDEELGPELMDCIRKGDHARAMEIFGCAPEAIEWQRRLQNGEFDEAIAKQFEIDMAKPDPPDEEPT